MTDAKDETKLTEDDVRSEHHRSAKPAAHWLYLLGVLGGGLLLMFALIAYLGGSG
jgi:hypothetical protein